jgi:hypothetical protein
MNSSKRKAKQPRAAAPTIWDSLKSVLKGIDGAAETLGYDVRDEDWRNRLRMEVQDYPCTLDDFGGGAEFIASLPKAAQARIRALELIDSFSDLRKRMIEIVSAADEMYEELQATIAAGPTPTPLSIKHYDEEAA